MSAAELIGRGKISLPQYLVLLICFLLNMLDGFDITVMSFTAPPIGQEFGLNSESIGVVFSATLAGMMLGAMFLAPLSDLLGRRKMIMGCVTVIGIGMMVTGYIGSLTQLVVMRFITGLGIGAMLASLAAISAEYLPERYRSFGVVCITAGYPFGATVGAFIAAPMINELGWRPVFFLGGVATTAMVGAVFFWVPESIEYLCNRRPANALGSVNRILARLGKAGVHALPEPVSAITDASGTLTSNVLSLLTKTRRTQTFMVWATFFFCFIALYFVMSWIPTLVVNSGLSLEKGIYASAALNMGGVVGIVLLGYLSTRLPLTRIIGSFMCGAAVLMMVFGAAPENLGYLMLLTAVIGLFMHGGFTGMYAVAAKLYPTEIRTTGVGWAIGLGRFGAVVGPYVGGLLIHAQYSMSANFMIFAIPLFLSGAMAFLLRVR